MTSRQPPAREPVPSGWATQPADPDTDDGPRSSAPRPLRRRGEITALAAIAAGGAVGAGGRYAAALLWPTAEHAFPWTTLGVNVVGCALMGVLMVLVTERFAAPPLVRPFLGTGVLGGFTTFSTATVDTQSLLGAGAAGTALAYAAVTLVAAAAAVWAGVSATRVVALRPRSGS